MAATDGSAPTAIAIVTGAASGMGAAAARLMGDAGWPLLLIDLDADRLAASVDALGADAAVETLAGDIAAPDFGERLAAAIGGRAVGAVIHCAGLSPTMGDAARILEVNLAASMRLVDAVRDALADGAAIVLFASSSAYLVGDRLDPQLGQVTTPDAVGSMLAFAADPGAAYGISKRGVQLLARREALSLGSRGIRVASVSPGIIDTPMGRQEMAMQPIMQTLVDRSALKRAARPDEVAAVAVFLCSPAASFVSGVDILVDGGSVAGLAPAG